jgi:hypothetical protein
MGQLAVGMNKTAQRRSDLHVRRNRAERLVRKRLEEVEDVYVYRSSWQRNGHGPEAFVAVIAREGAARASARLALADISGLSDHQWDSDWLPLSLGDWMIHVFPERRSD